MAHLYKRYMRLLNKWPLDKSKKPDLGQFIRDQIKASFPKGEKSKVENELECTKRLESLERLASNEYGKKYPVKFDKSATGLRIDLLNAALTEEFQQLVQEQKRGLGAKIKNTFIKYGFTQINQEEPTKKK